MALFEEKLDELKNRFKSLKTKRDIAHLLEIDYSSLVYYLYHAPLSKKYTRFIIPKRSGGEREIYAPAEGLKFVQRKLNFILQKIYIPKPCVFGFVKSKNIVKNAKVHSKQRNVLNIDLENFFPSINFGRVRAIFQAYPFYFNSIVATALSQICCFNNHLPQGAPTSPIISNFICGKLDSQLIDYANKYKCRYTRYADDLSFSSKLPELPFAIKELEKNASKDRIKIGDKLKKIIQLNGFSIHLRKGGLRSFKQRQRVTGLTVNEFPNVSREYIRQVRAMLYDWKRSGLDAAENRHFAKFNHVYRNPNAKPRSFKDILIGKINFIGMVRGKTDSIYQKFVKKIKDLDPLIKMKIEFINKPFIYTEGVTDWKHLKAALRNLNGKGLFLDLDLEFCEIESSFGEGELYKLCREKSLTTQSGVLIFIFDRDIPRTIKSVMTSRKPFKYWGNNVYSFVLPIPSHRNSQSITIELYYKDDELKRIDSFGRRLYLNAEFNRESGNHNTEQCRCDHGAIKNPNICVIDSNYNVLDRNGKNIALSKSSFAKNVFSETKNFNDFDFSEFRMIFDIIKAIKSYAQRHE